MMLMQMNSNPVIQLNQLADDFVGVLFASTMTLPIAELAAVSPGSTYGKSRTRERRMFHTPVPLSHHIELVDVVFLPSLIVPVCWVKTFAREGYCTSLFRLIRVGILFCESADARCVWDACTSVQRRNCACDVRISDFSARLVSWRTQKKKKNRGKNSSIRLGVGTPKSWTKFSCYLLLRLEHQCAIHLLQILKKKKNLALVKFLCDFSGKKRKRSKKKTQQQYSLNSEPMEIPSHSFKTI
jgi:hypothetical protein